MKLRRATVCLPTKDRSASHAFYAALGFSTVGEPGDDGIPEPLQFEISAGLRLMLIPTRGFGWVIGGRDRAPRGAHECLVVIGLPTSREVDELLRRAQRAAAPSSSRPATRSGDTPARSPIPTATYGKSVAPMGSWPSRTREAGTIARGRLAEPGLRLRSESSPRNRGTGRAGTPGSRRWRTQRSALPTP